MQKINIFLESSIKSILNKPLNTPLLGLCRSILAGTLLLTFLGNHPSLLFEVQSNAFGFSSNLPIDWSNLFSILKKIHLWFPHIITIPLLLLIISGYKPRYTCILHAWIANSFMRSVVIMEGGDQVHAILSLLLLPICLSDPRKFHWDKPVLSKSPYVPIISFISYKLICVQMSVIYLVASVSKFSVPEWMNGSAIYFWSTNPHFGLSLPLYNLFGSWFSNPWFVLFMNWSALIVELLLFTGLFAKDYFKRIFLILGILLHINIILIHGLFTFGFVMIAGLILFLGPISENKELKIL